LKHYETNLVHPYWEGFPMVSKVQHEAPWFGKSQQDEQKKTNKLPSFIARLYLKFWISSDEILIFCLDHPYWISLNQLHPYSYLGLSSDVYLVKNGV
jgi:hypothetical protein